MALTSSAAVSVSVGGLPTGGGDFIFKISTSSSSELEKKKAELEKLISDYRKSKNFGPVMHWVRAIHNENLEVSNIREFKELVGGVRDVLDGYGLERGSKFLPEYREDVLRFVKDCTFRNPEMSEMERYRLIRFVQDFVFKSIDFSKRKEIIESKQRDAMKSLYKGLEDATPENCSMLRMHEGPDAFSKCVIHYVLVARK